MSDLELFTDTEKTKKSEEVSGEHYIKGIIHINDDNDFEALYEEYFYTGLEPNGEFLAQSDHDVYLEQELKEIDWGFKPEVGKCYSVLFKFKMHYSKDWTDCGYEYDSEVECLALHIIPIDAKPEDFIDPPEVDSEMFRFGGYKDRWLK